MQKYRFFSIVVYGIAVFFIFVPIYVLFSSRVLGLSNQNLIDMKKYLLFAFILFMAMPNMAQEATVRSKKVKINRSNISTTLTVATPRTQSCRFWLYVDDVLQNDQSVRSICVRNLGEDSYYVRVELDNALQNCVGQFVDLRQTHTLAIVNSGKLYGLEASDVNVRPELTVDLKTAQVEPLVPPTPPVPPMPLPPHAMNARDYEEAYRLINDESFDSSKLSLAEQVVSMNPMSASQILGICKLFSFESNKLEFAKYAYEFCVDRNKYFLLNEAFTYESSKRELSEFIKGF